MDLLWSAALSTCCSPYLQALFVCPSHPSNEHTSIWSSAQKQERTKVFGVQRKNKLALTASCPFPLEGSRTSPGSLPLQAASVTAPRQTVLKLLVTFVPPCKGAPRRKMLSMHRGSQSLMQVEHSVGLQT